MKKVLITFMLTTGAISLLFGIFLNTILGFFHLVSVPVKQYENFVKAKQVVETMKKRTIKRKLQLMKNITKKASKRILKTSVAAVTLGTPAIFLVTSGFVIENYCDEQESLQQDSDLLNGTTTEFNLNKCANDARSDFQAMYVDIKNSTVDIASEYATGAASYSSRKWSDLNEYLKKLMHDQND